MYNTTNKRNKTNNILEIENDLKQFDDPNYKYDPVLDTINKYRPVENIIQNKQPDKHIDFILDENNPHKAAADSSFENTLSNVSYTPPPREGYKFNEGITLNTTSTDASKKKQTEYIENHLYETQNILEQSHTDYYTDPITGDKISNATPNKIWFANNILVVIASGAIFDNNDKEFAQNILNYFNIHENEYLGCSAKLYSYTSDLVTVFEKQAALQHGNYHLAVFIINYCTKEELKYSPEPLFNKKGLCECLFEETKIRDEMIRLMTTYGFSKFIPIQLNKAEKITFRDNETAVESSIQYNSDIDYNSATNRELFGNLKTEESIIGKRSRIKGNVDGQRSHPRMYKNKDTADRTNAEIVRRIESDDYITFNSPTYIKGANSKIADTTNTRLLNGERQDHYKLKDTRTDLLDGINPNNEITVNTYQKEESNAFKLFDEDNQVMQTPTAYSSMFSNVNYPNNGPRRRTKR